MKTVEFAYNNKIYSATKVSLFKVNYGQDPRMEFEGRRKKRYETTEKLKKNTEEDKSSTRENIGKNKGVCR